VSPRICCWALCAKMAAQVSASRRRVVRAKNKSKQIMKWPALHARAFQLLRLPYPPMANDAILKYLTEQQFEVLEGKLAQLKGKTCRSKAMKATKTSSCDVTELSQTLARACFRANMSPCIVPKSVLWFRTRFSEIFMCGIIFVFLLKCIQVNSGLMLHLPMRCQTVECPGRLVHGGEALVLQGLSYKQPRA
jgi:uncharacterized protein YggU (UPF0235/DUF167 family)